MEENELATPENPITEKDAVAEEQPEVQAADPVETAEEETAVAEAEATEEVAEDAEPGEEAVEAEAEEEADAAAPEGEEAAEEDSEKHWYVIHTYSGYENKVKKNLEHRIESMGMHEYIFQVVVPTEEEIEIRDGQRRNVERRIFPGYVLVQMILTDQSWYVVRNTPGVTGFVSSGTKPVPLRQEEIDKIIKRMEAEEPTIKVSFHRGERVQIISGPFAEFMGTVDAINMEKGKVTVLVSFFGRETPVEVDLTQVSRL